MRPFFVVYSFVAILGATMDLGLLWSIADTFNGLMSIPNLIALLLLSGTVVQLTKGLFRKGVRNVCRNMVVPDAAVIAILLALFTKEVYLSLFAGCALGALLVAEFHPWLAFDTLYNTMIESVDFSILMFMILLGMIVMLMQESGGTRAYGEWASRKLKSKKASLVATSLLGALIFCG